MLKNEMDILVIAHNICVAFDNISLKNQGDIIRRLREIEKSACADARSYLEQSELVRGVSND
jgi:hypothetical protein